MRKALVAVIVLLAASGIGIISRGCATADIDLREPIYLVIDESFWHECKYDLETEDECRESRVQQIRDGADSWFRHFDGATRPKVVIVYSEDDTPFLPVNSPIHIGLKNGYCELNKNGKPFVACYNDNPWSSPTIVFNTPDNITSAVFAHELGHALGRSGKHNDVAAEVYSIMSYGPRDSESEYVLPTDIKILCKMHPECPPHEDTWCEGGFWDDNRCPTYSYEEGEKIFKANQSAP